MKTSKIITLAMMALALSATPALAQRPGGGGGGGSRSGGGHSSSMSSSSRSSSGSSFSGSRSSSSSFSGSRSSSSSSRSSSYSSPSRSSNHSSSSRSVGTPSRSSSPSSVRSSSAPSRDGVRQAPTVRGAREAGVTPSRSGVRGSGSAATRGSGVREGASRRDVTSGSPRVGTRGSAPADAPGGRVSTGRANDVSPYARPGRPGGVLPPSHRPIHPAPYFHHPWHHHYVHCHPIFWDPLPPRPWYWPGFWLYCNSYWYDYHVTDVVVVREYVQNKYNVDLITYGISGDIMYAIVRDGGDTYLQVYDKDDHLLAEQKINRKYCNMVIDSENGGCWISKKNEKDALLFIWADGQLLIYEAD